MNDQLNKISEPKPGLHDSERPASTTLDAFCELLARATAQHFNSDTPPAVTSEAPAASVATEPNE